MSANVHLEVVVTDTGGEVRHWQSLVRGFDLQNTLQDVFYQHDAEKTDIRHKIMQFWKSRREDSPLNKVRIV